MADWDAPLQAAPPLPSDPPPAPPTGAIRRGADPAELRQQDPDLDAAYQSARLQTPDREVSDAWPTQ